MSSIFGAEGAAGKATQESVSLRWQERERKMLLTS